ncbi:hypothetical protein Pmani_037334 [Petrolisthes manimaculis]|uniref:eRF1 domain-containing protein n=1 Tax=Petrolisthes manimaculis TaxID=1843537 RepID=A0AAE1NJB7_9EUCA|nr:hypothetical protein Pmani_037334 [Petrolisthes manimaculis]
MFDPISILRRSNKTRASTVMVWFIPWRRWSLEPSRFLFAGRTLILSEQEKDKTHFTDKVTGVELERMNSMPLLKWLVNNYKSFGATLEIITVQSPEGFQYIKMFGAIGVKYSK